MSTLTQSLAWTTLEKYRVPRVLHTDLKRFSCLSEEACGILLDYSKQPLDESIIQALLKLAEQQNLAFWRQAMYHGQIVNPTENRPALHIALRNRCQRPIYVQGHNVMPSIQAVLNQMKHFVAVIQLGQKRGFTDQKITDIVTFGMGGSVLGAEMVTRALRPFQRTDVRSHFVSNIANLKPLFSTVDPQTTIFLLISKTFTTQETLINAHTTRSWFLSQGGDAESLKQHFFAITANTKQALDFGIVSENIFQFWDWIGGRFSLWSAVGLPIALATSMETFEALLDGAFAMDNHFYSAPLRCNLPVLMALVGIWNINFCNTKTLAILPYDHSLEGFIPYLQQLEMESNGKSVDRQGHFVDYDTAPIVFGALGTKGQHTFYQLLLQGTHAIACDFLASTQHSDSDDLLSQHHHFLLAHCLGQTQAFLYGTRDQTTTPTYHMIKGNRPVTTIMYERLDAYTLGALLALYEHKVFVQGVIWNINSFDQWGVELGKQLSQPLVDVIKHNNHTPKSPYDSSTKGLLQWIKKKRHR